MTRELVVSSSIVSVGYCRARNVLEVEFVRGGIYEYLNVPKEEHRALMSAASKGQHVNSVIKGRYVFCHVGTR